MLRATFDLKFAPHLLPRCHRDRRNLAAHEQLWKLDRQQQRRWVRCRNQQLDEGRIQHLVRCLRAIRAETPELSETVWTTAAYFDGHTERMCYAESRRRDLLVDSGVIDAGSRTVVGHLQLSGMYWTVDRANPTIALRCAQLSNRFDDYWEDHTAA